MARSPIHAKPCSWAQFKRLMPLKPPSSRKHKSTGQAFCNSLFPVLSKLFIKVLQELWRYSILIRSGVLRIHIFIHWGEIRTLYIESSTPSLKTMSQLSHERAQKKKKKQDLERLALMLSIIWEHARVLTLNFSLSNGVSKWSCDAHWCIYFKTKTWLFPEEANRV